MPGRNWRVVARRLNDFGDQVFDVYVGGTRKAWGMKDREVAERWAKRLAAGADADADAWHDAYASPDDATDDTDAETAAETDDDAMTVLPRRVWWND